MATKTRKCSQCGENSLELTESSFSIYGYDEKFHCSNCDFKTEITPAGGQGHSFAMYVLFMLVLYFMFLGGFDDRPWDTSDYVIFWFFALAGFWLTLSNYANHQANPVVNHELGGDAQDPVMSKTSFIHRFFSQASFLPGFLFPIIIIALVLGIATAIGMVNYYYFDDNLFG